MNRSFSPTTLVSLLLIILPGAAPAAAGSRPSTFSVERNLFVLNTLSTGQSSSRPQLGEAVDGLQISISSAGHVSPGIPQLRVEFRNTSSKDLNLFLGMIGGWSPRNCKLDGRNVPCNLNFKLLLTDRHGSTQTLEFKGIAYVAGRLDPYVVLLRPGATYVIELGLDQFYSPTPGGVNFKLGPGKYQASLQFDTPNDREVHTEPGSEKVEIWKGRVRSNTLEIRR